MNKDISKINDDILTRENTAITREDIVAAANCIKNEKARKMACIMAERISDSVVQKCELIDVDLMDKFVISFGENKYYEILDNTVAINSSDEIYLTPESFLNLIDRLNKDVDYSNKNKDVDYSNNGASKNRKKVSNEYGFEKG